MDARFNNDETGASAYDPRVMLKIVLLAYSRGLVSSRAIERTHGREFDEADGCAVQGGVLRSLVQNLSSSAASDRIEPSSPFANFLCRYPNRSRGSVFLAKAFVNTTHLYAWAEYPYPGKSYLCQLN
jgi:hypothetical protein